nr:hypothetical protein [Ligilactobacillus ruminis]
MDSEKYLRKVLTEITNIEVFDPERFPPSSPMEHQSDLVNKKIKTMHTQ